MNVSTKGDSYNLASSIGKAMNQCSKSKVCFCIFFFFFAKHMAWRI